jgi:F0F1-type ATP synthase membrane subunit b/b'
MDDPLVDATPDELFRWVTIQKRYEQAVNKARAEVNRALSDAHSRYASDLHELRTEIVARVESERPQERTS